MKIRFVVGLTLVLSLFTAVFSETASAVPVVNRDINSYVLFALDDLELKGGESNGSSTIITGGNVGVQNLDPNHGDGTFILGLGNHNHGVIMATPGTQIVGDSLRSGSDLNSFYDVFANELNAAFDGTILGAGPLPFTGPVVNNLPLFPSFVAGASDFNVNTNGNAIIAAGDYGKVNPKDGSTITFGAGIYNIRELHIGQNVTLNFDPGTILNIAEKMTIGDGSTFGNAGGIPNIYVQSINNTGVHDISVNLGKNTSVYAFIYSPFGEMSLGHASDIYGHFWAKGIHDDLNVNITFVGTPEPGTFALLGLGSLVAGYRRRKLASL